MKSRKVSAVVSGAVIILVVGLGYVLFTMKEQSDFNPDRPYNVPAEAVWAGGVDGGAWAILEQSEMPNQYQVTLYDDSGRVWIRGQFWNSQHALVSQGEIAQFDRGQLYLKSGAFLLPVGQQKRTFHNGTSITLSYPEPSSEYTDARDLTDHLLDSSTFNPDTP